LDIPIALVVVLLMDTDDILHADVDLGCKKKKKKINPFETPSTIESFHLQTFDFYIYHAHAHAQAKVAADL
jgi:hypothetical protein